MKRSKVGQLVSGSSIPSSVCLSGVRTCHQNLRRRGGHTNLVCMMITREGDNSLEEGEPGVERQLAVETFDLFYRAFHMSCSWL